MKKCTAAVLTAIFLCGQICADSPVAPRAYATTSWSGAFYFEMIPPRWNEAKDGLMDDGHGVAYQLLRDGSRKELWRTQDWYSPTVFLSEVGIYLVRLEPMIEGHGCSTGDLGIAFYKSGVLLRKYSTADIVADSKKAIRTVSHYFWLAADAQRMGHQLNAEKRSDLEPRLSLDNTFRLITCEGTIFVFDVTTGDIKSRQP